MDAAPTRVTPHPFGRLEDLDLAFADAARPALVTALLAQCAGGEPADWWAQPVGTRIAALLTLFAADRRDDRVELSAECLRPDCRTTFGFELPLADLAAQAPDTTRWDVALPDARRLTLRPPTGADLMRWHAARPATAEAARALMLGDLVIAGRPTPHDAPAIAAAVIAHDPLVSLTVGAACPACDKAQEVAVDLEGLVLSHFHSRQRAVLDEVHRLATAYGWSEPQILAIPPARRAAYLAILDGDAR